MNAQPQRVTMDADPRLALIDRLQGAIHSCIAEYVTGEPFALVDFPDYRNVGDSAIWLGEIEYFRSNFRARPAYVSALTDFSPEELDEAVPSGPIFIHGGGNFGDVWGGHQDLRERILECWPDRLVVQLPQSIHYSSAERAEQTARIIAKHKNFVLLVRDVESKEFAERHFDCEVRLCPDMAFSIGPIEPVGRVEFPVLAMLRTDVERVGSHDFSAYPGVPVEDWITEPRTRMRAVKALALAGAAASFQFDRLKAVKFDAAANERLRRGVRQLSRGSAIITDRLHVHIISLLLGRPHATLDNSYGKVGRFMAAFSGGTDLSHRAESLDDAIAWARAQAERFERQSAA
jgi:exopolysaccharide biosynthesis predicted pyruvyltransferase EpsI